MFEARNRFLASVLFACDLVALGGSWIWAFALRFSGRPIPVLHGVPPLAEYLVPLLFLPLIWAVLFRGFRLFRPSALDRRAAECADVVKATALAVLALMAAGYFTVKLDPSRVFLVYFFVLATINLIVVRLAFHSAVLGLRRRRDALRRTLIVGGGNLAHELRRRLDGRPELGLELCGPRAVSADELPGLIEAQSIDLVFFALPVAAQAELDAMLSRLQGTLVEIKVVPDLSEHTRLRSTVEELEGLPVVSINATPMIGWSGVMKRAFDLAVGLPLLALSAPLMALIALAVRLTSGSPVFYVQERVSLDGRPFHLVKFRTMHVDAERAPGPVWAAPDDPRRTRLGALLRRTSLDELPQLWHVVTGQMSLVGPRPERPVFIEEFRARVPRYMLRHRVKAGLTGWAQVNGWRGNTSIQRRLDHDLDYIRNWSLGLDVKILFLTVLRGFRDRNAY